jgi:hypothetical protein
VGSNNCRLVQSDESANSLPIPNCDAGPPTGLFVRASVDRLQTSCQALVSGDRMWAGRERSVANCSRPLPRKEMKTKLAGNSTGASAIGLSIAFECSG